MASGKPSSLNEFLVRPAAAWSLEVEKHKSWLERGDNPGSFYELLDFPCFADDRNALLSEVRAATKYYHQHQNHKTPAVVQRARSLQLLCASASHTVSDDEKWRAYDLKLMTRLQDEFLALKTPPEIRDWLREHGRVAPHRIEDLVRFVTSPASQSVQVLALTQTWFFTCFLAILVLLI